MRRALVARFSQHADLQRRLEALTLPVCVASLPAGVIQEVKTELA